MRRFLPLIRNLLLALFVLAPRPALCDPAVHAFVVIYDGWGSPTGFVVSGRVLEGQGASVAKEGAAESTNLADNLNALESDEVRGARVRVRVGASTYTATTDDDGVFVVEAKGLAGRAQLALGIAPVTVEVVSPKGVVAKPGVGNVFVHDDTRPFTALVSDVDDTIVKTHVTEKRKMLGAVLFKNAEQLEPVAGASKNYAAARAAGVSAFFYLSGSPQNFYQRIRTYIDVNAFPAGPVLLKNFGEDSVLQQTGYKATRLTMLLERFPHMNVILVGDSGEHDPEIYREVKRQHPKRVVAIVIRTTPDSDVSARRFDNMIVVDDAYAFDDVIARLVPTPVAIPTRSMLE